MVGNDVVDLRDPDSNAQTHPPRFDERVFSDAERRLIRESPESPHLRWCLWAAKEAAFKAARKRDGKTVFSPPRFEVDLRGANAGRVTHRRKGALPERFELRWWYADGAVHAVASGAGAPPFPGSELIHGFRRLHSDKAPGADLGSAWGPGQAVRDFARKKLGSALDVPAEALEIRMQGRVPVLWLGDRPAAADLSLSHHGEWIAFACWIGPRETPEMKDRSRRSPSSRWPIS